MEFNLTKYVDPRHGVDNEGNTVIGPTRPNASINPGPDTARGTHSGYFSGQDIRGFSQIHASGTGYGKFGEFLLSPQIGLAWGFTDHDSAPADEAATCSEYRVTLSRYGIRCAVTPAEHACIYRFTYPASNDASLLVDMAHSIPLLARIVNENNGISTSDILLNIEAGEGTTVLSGSGTYIGGFGPVHRLHFYAVVSKQAKSFGVYDGCGIQEGVSSLDKPLLSSREESAGGYLRFDTAENEDIYVKIAVSFLSVEKAKTYLEKEIPGWDYEGVKAETVRLWNRELNKIRISGRNLTEEELTIFYTSLYHTMMMPRDRTGDIPGFKEDTPMIDDHYAAWDTWRTVYSMYALIKPELMTKTVNSFIARYEKSGFVRDSFIGGGEMYRQQGGDNVDNIIADAYCKGIEGVDWKKAYAVAKNHADNFRSGWYTDDAPVADPNGPYQTYGYIPDDYKLPGTDFGAMACSYTLEMVYNDFCTATLAKDLGTKEDYEKYLNRSNNWTKLWNPEAKYKDFRGFIAPRTSVGTFIDTDFGKLCGSWVKHYYEATGYNYSFFVPHDPAQLIEKCGGDDEFLRRLTYGIDTRLVDYANEPAFLSVYLSAHTSKPWVLTDLVAKVRALFSLEGPPGNDDSGAMGSWYIFSSVGFFPNAGQNFYYLTSPWYDNTVITLGNGKQIVIKAHDLTPENRYIQSVTINGKRHRSTMFTHDMIKDGAVIEFRMGAEPVNYAL